MKKILLVEDDLSLIEGLRYFLEKQGYEVTVTRGVAEAEACIAAGSFDMVLLDVMLPDGSGFELCREIRRISEVPVIFLTASDEEANVVMGLDLGGDDYMTKPLKLNELISRMNAAWRRSGPGSEPPSEQEAILKSNGITVKLLEGRVIKDGTDLDLTAAEYRLLCLFMRNPKLVLTREQMMERLWGSRDSYVDDNTLAVYISRLRDKVEDDSRKPEFLTTIRGMGYRWNVVR